MEADTPLICPLHIKTESPSQLNRHDNGCEAVKMEGDTDAETDHSMFVVFLNNPVEALESSSMTIMHDTQLRVFIVPTITGILQKLMMRNKLVKNACDILTTLSSFKNTSL